MEGVIFITIVLLLHFFRNIQHPESDVSFKSLFRNVNASGVVICQYPQIY